MKRMRPPRVVEHPRALPNTAFCATLLCIRFHSQRFCRKPCTVRHRWVRGARSIPLGRKKFVAASKRHSPTMPALMRKGMLFSVSALAQSTSSQCPVQSTPGRPRSWARLRVAKQQHHAHPIQGAKEGLSDGESNPGLPRLLEQML